MALKRKAPKKIENVTFTLDGWDGEFSVPPTTRLPLYAADRLDAGDPEPTLDFLLAHSDKDSGEAVQSFDNEEFIAFSKAWGEASRVSLGKSSGSSEPTESTPKASKRRSSSAASAGETPAADD